MNNKLILLFGIVAIALVISGCCCITTTTTPTVTIIPVNNSAVVQKDLNMSPTSTATPVGLPTTGIVTAVPNRSGNVTTAPSNGSPSL